MAITEDEVKKTAELARLDLTPAECTRLTGELVAILGYVETLTTLDVTGVEPTFHAVPLHCALVADEPGPQLTTPQALAAAPQKEGPFFEVPKIIEVGS